MLHAHTNRNVSVCAFAPSRIKIDCLLTAVKKGIKFFKKLQ